MADGFSLAGKRVWVAGHRGLVGAAIVRRLARERCTVLTVERASLDLRNQSEVHSWLRANAADVVFLAAAKVGGILANDLHPATFIYDNLMIEANVIHASYEIGVKKLIFLGSSCVYPKHAAQPMGEDALLTGPLEPTNQWYAIAKIAGLKLCEAYRKQHGVDFVSGMPTNLYGPGDNYDLNGGHVLPALICKAHAAKTAGSPSLTIWGTGSPLREFLYVDDCADALMVVAKSYSAAEPINIGSGAEISILELARLVAGVVGFRGEIVCDRSKPDGAPRKLIDSEKLRRLGWTPTVGLREGIEAAYRDFVMGRCGKIGIG